jgi:hypothetical protein
MENPSVSKRVELKVFFNVSLSKSLPVRGFLLQSEKESNSKFSVDIVVLPAMGFLHQSAKRWLKV